MAEATTLETVARGTIKGLHDTTLHLGLAGTSYELNLLVEPPGRASELRSRVGKKVAGEIHAQALKIEVASAGGKFIEPLQGAPRIIAGTVIASRQGELCIDVGVPMWVAVPPGQDAGDYPTGRMVNCYVQSGCTMRL